MKLSIRQLTGVRRALSPCLVSSMAVLAFAGALTAHAQQVRAGPEPLSRNLASSRMSAPPPATRYEDTASQREFVLDRSGEDVLMKFEDSPEVMALQSTTAQRGDAFLRSDSGELKLRVTELGNVISYVGNKDGAPAAAMAAPASPLDAPAMTEDLTERVTELRDRLTDLAGHDVTVFGTGAFANDERWVLDALMVTQMGVERAGPAVNFLQSVRLVRVETPYVVFDGGELMLGVNPAEGYAGRPSSEAIAYEMTSSGK